MKRAGVSLVFFFLIFVLTEAACPAATDYYAFSDSEKRVIFLDDFNDNRNGWNLGSSNSAGAVVNGHYRYESKYDGSKTTHKSVEIDEKRDFEIEVRLKIAKGKKTMGSGMVWGLKRKPYGDFGFLINNNGSYDISRYRDDYHKFVDWTKAGSVKRDDFNKLTIRKVGGKYYFYANEKLLHTMPFQPFFGNRLGFQVASFSVILVDSIRVSYLEKRARNQPPEIIIAEPDTGRGPKTVASKRVRVAGTARDADGIYEVKANGIEAQLSEGGSFAVSVPLAVGENTIVVTAVDTRMMSSQRTLTVNRRSQIAAKATGGGGEGRLALVIGNANYTYGGSLANPVNDARAIKGALEGLGFRVVKYENCSQKAIKRAMDEFGRELKGHDVGLFFYAGHGVQVKGINYLIPTDARLENENDVDYDCVQADRILAKMEAAGSRTNIVILDACRDNPFERSWRRSARGSGLAFMNAPSGSLIAYATSPGNTASDGTGKNGIYTSAILKHITTPRITILQMFQRVRTTVLNETASGQTPWESTSLRGDFFFRK